MKQIVYHNIVWRAYFSGKNGLFFKNSAFFAIFGLFAVQNGGKMGNVVKYFFLEGKFMNKTELIDAIAKEAGLSKKDAAAALNAFTDTVTKELKKKGKVQLVGFGTFETTKRAARTGKNPQTGAAIKIPASVAPKFKAGKALKDLVNKK